MIIIDWMMAGTWVFGLVEYVNTLDFYTFQISKVYGYVDQVEFLRVLCSLAKPNTWMSRYFKGVVLRSILYTKDLI